MYAACMTRGDVAYHTSFLSQFSKLPFQEAWEALVRLLVCLYATRKHALTFGGKEIKIPDAPTCKPKLNPSQEAACGGGKVAIPAILTRLPDPGRAVRLQDCKVSTFGRALHRLDQVQAAWRAAARHWWQFAAVAKSRFSPCSMGGTFYGQIVILAC
jgi:hypothetical protein